MEKLVTLAHSLNNKDFAKLCAPSFDKIVKDKAYGIDTKCRIFHDIIRANPDIQPTACTLKAYDCARKLKTLELQKLKDKISKTRQQIGRFAEQQQKAILDEDKHRTIGIERDNFEHDFIKSFSKEFTKIFAALGCFAKFSELETEFGNKDSGGLTTQFHEVLDCCNDLATISYSSEMSKMIHDLEEGFPERGSSASTEPHGLVIQQGYEHDRIKDGGMGDLSPIISKSPRSSTSKPRPIIMEVLSELIKEFKDLLK